MKLLLPILISMVCFAAKSQTTVLKFSFIDAKDLEPIVSTQLILADSGKFTNYFSNLEGFCYVQVPTSKSVAFTIEHSSYEALKSFPSKKYSGKVDDTLLISVKMNFIRVNEILDVIIRPEGFPDTVYSSKRLSVNDFEFFPNGDLLLLTYPKNVRKSTELIIFDGSQEKSKIPLLEKGKELIRDYKNAPCVVTDKNVYGIHALNGQIQIEKIDKEYFDYYIKPIVDTNTKNYFFSNYRDDIPAFDYFSFHFNDSAYKKIAKVQDDFMMELYRSEYKYVDVRTKLWAKEKQNETGIDKEIWVGMTAFVNSPYYKSLYAPLIEVRDTLCLFDHYRNLLFHYDSLGNKLDSIAIFHHLQAKITGYKKQIIKDPITEKLYVVYEKNGKTGLREVSIKTGELGAYIDLTYKYVEKVAVYGNFVYYIYRPFESLQKKYLYKEKLPSINKS